MDASISAMSIASCGLLYHRLLVITIAFLCNTHFKNWEWNSILDRQTILMTIEMAVVKV